MKKKETQKRDFISIADFSPDEVGRVLQLAASLKKKPRNKVLAGKTVGLVFQKPSTRTSVSFAVGVNQLGGHPLILNADVLQIKRGETPKDTGRVLSRYLDLIVIRANSHDDVLEMASYSSVPVINGLTNREHPCQILADIFTLMEKKKIRDPKKLKGLQISYVGDGNNVAASLALAAVQLGMKLNIASPEGYHLSSEVLENAKTWAKKGGGSVHLMQDPTKAVQGSHVVYTDVWASMGQESENDQRKRALAPYQVNAFLLRAARPDALVMHCLPAHRGEEITEDVIEGKNSVVFDQAENRLHVQKAILATLIKGSKRS